MAPWTLTGTTLVTLPPVDNGGVSSPITALGTAIVSLGGATTTQVIARKRSWTISFGFLTDAEYDTLLQFRDGRQGEGPFTLRDPREAAGVIHKVALPLDGALNDDSTKAGHRADVVLTLNEV